MFAVWFGYLGWGWGWRFGAEWFEERRGEGVMELEETLTENFKNRSAILKCPKAKIITPKYCFLISNLYTFVLKKNTAFTYNKRVNSGPSEKHVQQAIQEIFGDPPSPQENA
jgi:hypothetical protein